MKKSTITTITKNVVPMYTQCQECKQHPLTASIKDGVCMTCLQKHADALTAKVRNGIATQEDRQALAAIVSRIIA